MYLFISASYNRTFYVQIFVVYTNIIIETEFCLSQIFPYDQTVLCCFLNAFDLIHMSTLI